MSAQASRGKLTSRSSAHEGRHSALVGYAGYKLTGKHSHRTSFIKSHAKMVGSFLYKMPVYVFCTQIQCRLVVHLAQLCCTCSHPTPALYMQLSSSCMYMQLPNNFAIYAATPQLCYVCSTSDKHRMPQHMRFQNGCYQG